MGIIEKKSNSQAIADYILSRILDGTLRSGDKLDTERSLSEQLGVSRVSVREALSGLIVLGILEARQGAGTFVAGQSNAMIGRVLYANAVLHDHGTMDEIMVVKRSLEAECARYAAQFRTDNDLQTIQDALAAYDAIIPEDPNTLESLQKVHNLDTAVHRSIVNASHQEYLIQIFATISASFEECRAQHVQTGQMSGAFMRRAQQQHRQIAIAVEEQEAEFAYHTMYAHLKSVERHAR